LLLNDFCFKQFYQRESPGLKDKINLSFFTLFFLFVIFSVLAAGKLYSEEIVIEIAVSRGNIRETADVKSNRLGSAERGQRLFVLEERAEWFLVLLPDGQKGWIHKSIVTKLEDPGGVVTEVPITVTHKTGIPLFEKPDFLAKRLKDLKVGEVLKLMEVGAGWLKVLSGPNLVGWIPNEETLAGMKSSYRDTSSIRDDVFIKLLRMLEDYNREKMLHPKFLEAKWYPAFTIFQKKENVKVAYVAAFSVSIELDLYVQRVSTENFFSIQEETFLFFPNADKIFLSTILRTLLDEPASSKVSINLYLLKHGADPKNTNMVWEYSGRISMEKEVVKKVDMLDETFNYWGLLSENSVPKSAWK